MSYLNFYFYVQKLSNQSNVHLPICSSLYSPGNPTAPAPPPAIIGSPDQQQQKISTVALHSTEALMAGFLKSTDLGPHGPHGYGSSHHPHHAHPHGPLPPGMPMTSLAPFGLPHGLDAVGFPQGMWGKYSLFSYFLLLRPASQ